LHVDGTQPVSEPLNSGNYPHDITWETSNSSLHICQFIYILWKISLSCWIGSSVVRFIQGVVIASWTFILHTAYICSWQYS